MPPKSAAVLRPLKWLCMSCAQRRCRAGVPVATPAGRSGAAQPSRPRSSPGPAGQRRGWPNEGRPRGARPGGAAADARGRRGRPRLPARRTASVARLRREQHGEPAQVDRDAEHGVDRRRPAPAATARRPTTGRSATTLATRPRTPGGSPASDEQGQAERAAEERVRREQAGVCRERTARRAAATGARSAARARDHGEGDEGGDDIGEQVAAGGRPRTAVTRGQRQHHPAGLGDRGPGEQPHGVVLAQGHDVAERHLTPRRAARRRRGPERPAARRPARRRAGRPGPPTLEVAGEERRDRHGAPAYASGVHAWKGTRESLNRARKQPGRRRARARPGASDRPAPQRCVGVEDGLPVAA